MNDHRQEEALVRSVVYGALALGLGPPTDEVRDRVASGEGARHLGDALGALGLSARVKPVNGVPIYEDHARFFGHTLRGEVCPYETEWGKDSLFRQPEELADLAAFLAAFGLKLEPSSHERVDHVACECELMSFLAAKEAYHRERDELESAEELRRAQRLFLRDHLGRFAPAFATTLLRQDPGGFYGSLGRALRELVLADCVRFEVDSGPDSMGLRPPADDDVPMACGAGGSCLTDERPV